MSLFFKNFQYKTFRYFFCFQIILTGSIFELEKWSPFRGKLFGGTVPPNNTLFGGTVPPYTTLFGGTVPPNNTLFGGTVPPNSTLFGGTPDSEK